MSSWRIVNPDDYQGDSVKKQEKSKKSIVEEMAEMFVPEHPIHNLDDLIVSKSVRSQIDTALNHIKFHDVLYEQWNLKKVDPHGRRIAINLHGEPGTGKTFCAEAIAHFFDRQIIKVKYAEIESKYVGDTSKAISGAFLKAKEANSVLFFDEADSILGKRLTSVTQSADHGVNISRSTMLLELDKFVGIILFATNLPNNYDSAFVRRILAHIKFELPDLECRKKLWSYLIPNEVPKAKDIAPQWLAQESKGLSGGDILNVVKLSASRAVSRDGEERRVFRNDIKESIMSVKEGKAYVGNNIHNSIENKTEIMDASDLPSELKERQKSCSSEIVERSL